MDYKQKQNINPKAEEPYEIKIVYTPIELVRATNRAMFRRKQEQERKQLERLAQNETAKL